MPYRTIGLFILFFYSSYCIAITETNANPIGDIYGSIDRKHLPSDVINALSLAFNSKASTCDNYLCFKGMTDAAVKKIDPSIKENKLINFSGNIVIDDAKKVGDLSKEFFIVFRSYRKDQFSEFGCYDRCEFSINLAAVSCQNGACSIRAVKLGAYAGYGHYNSRIEIYFSRGNSNGLFYFISTGLDQGNNIDKPDHSKTVSIAIFNFDSKNFKNILDWKDVFYRSFGRDIRKCGEFGRFKVGLRDDGVTGGTYSYIKENSPCGIQTNFSFKHPEK